MTDSPFCCNKQFVGFYSDHGSIEIDKLKGDSLQFKVVGVNRYGAKNIVINTSEGICYSSKTLFTEGERRINTFRTTVLNFPLEETMAVLEKINEMFGVNISIEQFLEFLKN